MCFLTGETHITSDMCSGKHISRGNTYHCATWNLQRARHCKSNAIELNFNRTQSGGLSSHLSSIEFGNRTKSNSLCNGHIFTSFVFPQFTSFHSVFHSFHGLMNSMYWPAHHVCVFIAQLVEHCCANAEATGSNPVEAPKNSFSGYFAIA